MPSGQGEHTPLFRYEPEAQEVQAVAVQVWQLAEQLVQPVEVFLYPTLHTHVLKSALGTTFLAGSHTLHTGLGGSKATPHSTQSWLMSVQLRLTQNAYIVLLSYL